MALRPEHLGGIRRPSLHYSLGFLTLGGFLMGIVFWGGFNTALELTNTETFCTGCHEMRDNVFQELRPTIHYTNRSGVRATCPDCHVPHGWTTRSPARCRPPRRSGAAIFGTINTREKFLEKRHELASREWARLEANDSLECRNCHSAKSMDITRQSQRAAGRVISADHRSGEALQSGRSSWENVPDSDIIQEFTDLHNACTTHAQRMHVEFERPPGSRYEDPPYTCSRPPKRTGRGREKASERLQ